MKIGVAGLWHLGSVYSACLASLKHEVVGYDPNGTTTSGLSQGKAPIFEPGLSELIEKGLKEKNLRFSSQPSDLLECDVVLLTFDTPVDAKGEADVPFVLEQAKKVFPSLKRGAVFLICSQVPVGSILSLEKEMSRLHGRTDVTFCYSPENLRLGEAIKTFFGGRFVVGTPDGRVNPSLEKMLQTADVPLEWMRVASAEMTKHALNAFLATSVVFINDIASLCEHFGADAREVERGLKTDVRIGPKAYLRPGSAYAGGTFARDIGFLTKLSKQAGLSGALFSAVDASNTEHRQWAQRKLEKTVGSLCGKKIALFGLTYKADTDTLRCSDSVALAQWLHEKGAAVSALDAHVRSVPDDLSYIGLENEAEQALNKADALVVFYQHERFQKLDGEQLRAWMQKPLILDPLGLFEKSWGQESALHYYRVGKTV